MSDRARSRLLEVPRLRGLSSASDHRRFFAGRQDTGARGQVGKRKSARATGQGNASGKRSGLATAGYYPSRAMLSITPAERRALRAKAHRLHPVVRVGQQGLTASVLHEIDVNLLAHELIKVRVFSADHGAREGLFARICAELEAAPVQHIGKLLVVWRPAPPPSVAPARAPKPSRRSKTGAAPATRRRERVLEAPPRARAESLAAAKSKPQARRPREPAPRAPSRPPAFQAPLPRGGSPSGGGRRRGRGGQNT